MWVETAIQYHQKNLEQKENRFPAVYMAARWEKVIKYFLVQYGIDRRQEFSK